METRCSWRRRGKKVRNPQAVNPTSWLHILYDFDLIPALKTHPSGMCLMHFRELLWYWISHSMRGKRNMLLTSPSESYHSPRSLSSHQNPMIQMVYLPCLSYPASALWHIFFAPCPSFTSPITTFFPPHWDHFSLMTCLNCTINHFFTCMPPRGKSLIICLLLVTRKREVSKI